mmetsp:Transcript_26596/g.79752  ORF Transcript_26596/g.79752 Transcript_26596/m.79752 type:complete len:276 (+) Transcript_26596:133-960(+)
MQTATYGAVAGDVAPPKKSLGRKLVVALAAFALVGGLAAVTASQNLGQKSQTTATTLWGDWRDTGQPGGWENFDPTMPSKYTPYQPNNWKCVIGCQTLCGFAPTDSTRITCCTKEECENMPPAWEATPAPRPWTPPPPVTKSCAWGNCDQSGLDVAGDITCAGGGCNQSNSRTKGIVTCAGGKCDQSNVTAWGKITCTGSDCLQTGATSMTGEVSCPSTPCRRPPGGGYLKTYTSYPSGSIRLIPEYCKAPDFNCDTMCQSLPTHDATLTCCHCV